MNKPQTTLLGPWRRGFQWLVSLTILLLPFGHWHGRSLLRIDLNHLSLQLFGQVLGIEELYLLLFFSLAFGLFFLLVTMVFGRVWCGWACPQTTLSDIAEWLTRRLRLRLIDNRLQGALWRKLILHSCYLLLALLVGANLVWYFIEPQRFFLEIARGTLHLGAWLSMAIIALTVYLDLALLRRIVCRDFCPYGRFQTALADPGTLTLNLPADEAKRCIKCGACVRSCPMEIDIRQGYQVECINCGRCLDACRQVMARRQEPGLIGYSFGTEGRGLKALLNPRTLLVTVAMLLLSCILAGAIYLRPEASFKIALSHTAVSRILPDGNLATFFNAWIGNRQEAPLQLGVVAHDRATGATLPLKGQVKDIELAPGAHQEFSFVLVTPVPTAPRRIEFLLVGPNNLALSKARITLMPP